MKKKIPPIVTPIAIVSIGLALGATTTIVNSSPTYGLKKSVTTETTEISETSETTTATSAEVEPAETRSTVEQERVDSSEPQVADKETSSTSEATEKQKTTDSNQPKETEIPTETSSSEPTTSSEPESREAQLESPK